MPTQVLIIFVISIIVNFYGYDTYPIDQDFTSAVIANIKLQVLSRMDTYLVENPTYATVTINGAYECN